jgi:hypothetical protein
VTTRFNQKCNGISFPKYLHMAARYEGITCLSQV